jgi:GNAT superfamily N-acetyltransferase
MKNINVVVGTENETNELSNELFNFNKDIVPGFAERDYPSDFIRYVIKQDNILIAGVVGRITLNHIVYVDDLFVIEKFRKQGYATALLDKVESEAKLRGCYLAYLDTINPKAVSFYKKRNYKIFATLDNVPCPNVSAVYLTKDL